MLILDSPGPTREYARAAHIFLTAGPREGAGVDFMKRKLIGIGHSFGAASLYVHVIQALVQANSQYLSSFLMRDLNPRLPWQSFICIEPGLTPDKDFPGSAATLKKLQSWVWLRQDTWASKAVAIRELAKHPVFSQWDPRVLTLYVVGVFKLSPSHN